MTNETRDKIDKLKTMTIDLKTDESSIERAEEEEREEFVHGETIASCD